MKNRLHSIGMALMIPSLILTASIDGKVEPRAPKRVGWREWVEIYPGKFRIKAKMDTGAKNSSVNAPEYEVYECDGRKMVRFKIVDRKGKNIGITLPLVRMAKIKERDGSYQTRPVVELDIKLGGERFKVETNLVNRSHFLCPLLLGRSFMIQAKLLVDSSVRYLMKNNARAQKP